jgi:leucyl-tRNA synthetase
MPRAVFANGHVLVNGEKMSKSKGNFILLEQGLRRFSPDALRVALADAGDTLDDANFETAVADRNILTLTKELAWAQDVLRGDDKTLPLRRGAEGDDARGRRPFVDRYFLAALDELVDKTDQAYASMRFRDALQFGFFTCTGARDIYRDMCAKMGEKMHAETLRRYIEVQAVLAAPIAPHWSEELWELLGNRGSVTRAAWPASSGEARTTAEAGRWVVLLLSGIRQAIDAKKRAVERAVKAGKGKPEKVDVVTLVLATEFAPWQRRALEILSESWDEAAGALHPEAAKRVSEVFRADEAFKPVLKDAMKFAGSIASDGVKERGRAALATTPRFNDFEVVQDTERYVDAMLRDYGVVRFAFFHKDAAPAALADKVALALPTVPFILISSSDDAPIA